jgi:hypothetical protein
MVFGSRSGGERLRRGRLYCGSLVVILGASAFTIGVAAVPAMATASDCVSSGTGYAAETNSAGNGAYQLQWHQVWSKNSRAFCTDFYLTSQTVGDNYAGFYKDVNDTLWTISNAGFVHENAGSDGNAGIDFITNVQVNTQMNIGGSLAFNTPWNEYITVKF